MGNGERRLKDGRAVGLRAAGPGDVPAITRLYLELTRESFRSRFQTSQPSPALVARLARLEPRPGIECVVAAAPDDPERLVGEARFVAVGEETAELAVTVLDGYQGAGLGHVLLAELVGRAQGSGLKRLRAIVDVANTPMLRLLEPYGWALAEATDGFSVACLEISAIGGMPGWPPGAEGRRVLVERRGWFDDERVAALRTAGDDVRLCRGPRGQAGWTCPLVAVGRCRLAEEADLIVDLLPGDDEDCAAVLAAHRRRWPGRLAPGRAGEQPAWTRRNRC